MCNFNLPFLCPYLLQFKFGIIFKRIITRLIMLNIFKYLNKLRK